MAERFIYHICKREEWVRAQEMGEYIADSLVSEGFIHFSTKSQVIDTANRYYKGEIGLILLCVDVERLKSEVKFEMSGAGVFPHVYGPVEVDAVMDVLKLEIDVDGIYIGSDL